MRLVHSVRNRVRPKTLLATVAVVAAATYFEFVYAGPSSPYEILLWIVVVPLLFAAVVEGVRDHPLFRPFFHCSLVAIGTLQYLAGNWLVLAGVFALAGVAGLVSDRRDAGESGTA